MENDRLLDIDNLKSAIEEFRALDFNISEVKDADKLFRKIIKGFYVYPIEWYKGTLYRARKHSQKNTLFKNTRDLIYPLNPLTRGRLNNIGESIFYGAMNRDTAFVELRLKKGDELTLLESKRINTQPLLFMEVGVKELIVNQNYKPEFNKLQRERYEINCNTEEKRIRYDLINTFLIDEITKLVSDSETHNYKGTNAIGEYYIKGNPKTEGMFYPSIARNGTGCIALKPESYHKFFAPDKCFKCIVKDIKSTGEIILYCENSSKNISEIGEITWQQ